MVSIFPVRSAVSTDSAFGFIRMKNGATIVLESSWALNTLDTREAQTTLCGTKAGADMADGLRINRVNHSHHHSLSGLHSQLSAIYHSIVG